MIREVPTCLVLDLWPVVEPLLAKAARHHPFADTDCMLAALLAGKSALFVVLEDDQVSAALIAEVEEYANGRVVGQVWGMGGIPGVLKRCQPELEALLDTWCARHGCDTIAVVGRPGWRRLLRNFDSVPLTLAWRRVHVPGRNAAAASTEQPAAPPAAVA